MSKVERIEVEVYCEQTATLGEGPLWSVDEQALYWLDIGRKVLHRKGPSEMRRRSWSLPEYPGCLAELATGTIAIAMGNGLQRLNLEFGAIDLLCAAPHKPPGTRFNDGKVDPRGRFWAGTMQNNFGPHGEPIAIERSDGALYRFDPDGSVHTMEENLGVPNTLAWSPDLARFYFADSLRGQIYAYDFDADSGAARNKRAFFEAPEHGIPDGSAIDSDGCLWNVRWDGAAILRITPHGKLDRLINLPVPRPTSCAFGGPNLDTLYVTSATNGLTAAQREEFPLSGSVFAIAGVGQGVRVPRLADRSAPRASTE
jgi:L-arabinonolactonase